MLFLKIVAVMLSTRITRCHALCKPTFTQPSRQYNPGETFLSQCNIQNNNECNAIGNTIALQRLHKGTWHTALEVDPSSTTFFVLDYGYTFEERMITSEAAGIYYLTVTNASIDDSGDWRCGVVDADSVFPSDSGSFVVTTSYLTTTDLIVTKTDDLDVVYKYPNRYSCSSQQVYPGDLQVIWTIGEETSVTESTSYMNGYVYRVENMRDISFNDVNATKIICTLGKLSEPPWNVSNELEIDADSIIAPPDTVAPINATNPTVTNGLVVEYTAEGDNITITWTINDDTLNPDYIKVTHETLYGDYNFGRNTALKSTLTLENIKSCSDEIKVAGYYKCSVVGTRRDVEIGDNIFIGTECKEPFPCWGIALITMAVVAALAVPIVILLYLKKKKKNKGPGK